MKFDVDSFALPDEVKEVVAGLIEGTIKSLVIIAEMQDGQYLEGIFNDMDGGQSHKYGMIGALESIKRDWQRMFVESRIEYLEFDDLLEEGEDDDD